jgi:hypothetical protein
VRLMICQSCRRMLILAFVVSACASGDIAPDCEPFWSDVPIVELSDSDSREIALEEVWRVGGSTPGQEIAEPASVAVSSAGYAAIVDFSLGEVSVISPRGRWIGSWARRGRGPGELTMPVAANWAGDTLIVYDIEQSKISRYRSGESLGDTGVPPELSAAVAASGAIAFVAVRSDGTVILQQPLRTRAASDSSELTVLQASPGSAPDTLLTAYVHHVAWDDDVMPHPAGAMPRIAVGPDNWFAVTASDGSRRVLVGRDEAVRQLCGTAPALPLSAHERGSGAAPAGFEAAFDALGAAPEPRELSSIGRVVIRSNGDVWIDARRPRPFTRESLTGVPGGFWDTYDPSGEHIGTVHVSRNVAIQAVSDSIAVGIEFNDMDEAWVIGYRLSR